MYMYSLDVSIRPSPLELSSQKVNLISIILHSEKGRGEGAGLYIF